MAVLKWDVAGLPEAPLDAAAAFHAGDLRDIRNAHAVHPQHDMALVFATAPQEHRAWRLAAVQELAREFAPTRVNGIVGVREDAIAEAIAYLGAAPGVTGQLLVVG